MTDVVQLDRRPAYVKADVVADYLGIGKSTVYELAKKDQIPHRRIGKRKLFVLAEIDEWLESQRRGPGA